MATNWRLRPHEGSFFSLHDWGGKLGVAAPDHFIDRADAPRILRPQVLESFVDSYGRRPDT